VRLRLNRKSLLRARELLGYGIEKVAEEARVSKNSVLRAEHEGDIRPLTARRIAAALKVDVADLLQEGESPTEASRWSFEPSFNDILEEERRADYYRPWTNLLARTAARWEAEIVHYHQMPPLEVAGKQTKQPFDSGIASEVSAEALDLMLALQEVGTAFAHDVRGFVDAQHEFQVRSEMSRLLKAYERLNHAADEIVELSKPRPEASFAEMQERQRVEREARERRQIVRQLTEEIA
jgi:hypothetical protein